jgi:hypothetical protein
VRLLDRAREDVRPGRPVLLPFHIHLLAGEEALEDADGLDQPLDANAAGLQWDAELPIVGLDAGPASPETQLQAPTGQEVQRGGLAGQQHGITDVVREDVRPDSERARRHRHGRQGRDRRQRWAERVRDRERRKAQLLGAPGGGDPGLDGRSLRRDHTEAERMTGCHGILPCRVLSAPLL